MNSPRQVAIIRTGTANLASVRAAFHRLGIQSYIVKAPSELQPDDPLVLPGVGAFQAGMAALREQNWESVLRTRLESDLPTLAICLGLQLLCLDSQESPGIAGLGLLPVHVERLPSNVSVPQFGWNWMQCPTGFFEPGYVFYANSYCLSEVDRLTASGWQVATSEHGLTLVAAVRKGRFVGCQFHPELSGSAGQELLARWLGRKPDSQGIRTDNQESSLC